MIVTNNQGCADTSVCTTISGLGLMEELNAQIQLTPMPFSTEITLNGLKEGKSSLTISSLDGRLVFATEHASNGSFTLDLPSGQYILTITTEDRLISKRIVRE